MSFWTLAAGILGSMNTKRLLFVVGDSTSPHSHDVAIKSYLESEGLAVDYVDDNSLTGQEAGYAGYLVSSTVNSQLIASKLKDSTKGVANMEFLSWVDCALCAAIGTDTSVSQLRIVNQFHPITSGYDSFPYAIFATDGSIRHMQSSEGLPGSADILAESEDGRERPSLVAYSENVGLVDGTNAHGRRVAIPFTSDEFLNLNSVGLDIFSKSVRWVVGAHN